MRRKFLAAVLALSLAWPEIAWAHGLTGGGTETGSPTVAKADPPAAAPAAQQTENPQATRPQPSAAKRRSYEREVHGRRHPRISKKEWIFLGAVAGTSMGIGALAAGPHGLAIGAIVGGWSAYTAHRLWNKIR